MALWRSGLVSAAFAPVILLAAPFALAGTGDISFCNEFPHTLYIAIAYMQYENNYLSRGWLEVETGKCYVFDTAIRVPAFYFHAESEPYRDGKHKVTMEWGSDKKFAVRDANFQSYNAEKAYSGMHFVGFTKSPDSSDGGPITAIVTFTETGGSNTVIPAPEKPAAQSSGGEAPPHAAAQAGPAQAGQAAAPSSSGSEGGIEDGPNPSDATLAPPGGGGDNNGNGRDSGPRQ